MTSRELKKLTRVELLEMLLQQVEENESLRQELESTKEELQNRTIMIQQSGSMAEAALRLNGVFDQAQQAADDYLQSIRIANEDPESHVKQIISEAQAQADAIVEEARLRSELMRAEADEYWKIMRRKVQTMMEK